MAVDVLHEHVLALLQLEIVLIWIALHAYLSDLLQLKVLITGGEELVLVHRQTLLDFAVVDITELRVAENDAPLVNDSGTAEVFHCFQDVELVVTSGLKVVFVDHEAVRVLAVNYRLADGPRGAVENLQTRIQVFPTKVLLLLLN